MTAQQRSGTGHRPIAESSETVFLKLSNAVNAVFGNTTGIGTILTDD